MGIVKQLTGLGLLAAALTIGTTGAAQTAPVPVATPPAPVAVAPATLAHAPRPLGDVRLWVSLEDFPPEAYAAMREGRVQARLHVAALGFVDGCTAAQSSGSLALDTAVCQALQSHAFFSPATNEQGQPIAGEFLRWVRWSNPDAPAAPTTAVPAPPATAPAAPR